MLIPSDLQTLFSRSRFSAILVWNEGDFWYFLEGFRVSSGFDGLSERIIPLNNGGQNIAGLIEHFQGSFPEQP